jgi:hypothetical protein
MQVEQPQCTEQSGKWGDIRRIKAGKRENKGIQLYIQAGIQNRERETDHVTAE